MSGQKLTKNAENGVNFGEFFENLLIWAKKCYQTWSVLIDLKIDGKRQKLKLQMRHFLVIFKLCGQVQTGFENPPHLKFRYFLCSVTDAKACQSVIQTHDIVMRTTTYRKPSWIAKK